MGTRFKGDTKDPVVNITTWCLLVVMILSVLSRLGTKIRLFRQLIVDDFLIITSLVCCPMCLPKYRLQQQSDTEFSTQVFGVGQSVAVSLAVGSGYGKHLEDLTKDEMDHMMKVIGGTVCYIHFQDPRLMPSLTGNLRRVSSMHLESFILQTVSGHLHSKTDPDL